MALFARTTVETADFVSTMDSAYSTQEAPVDPADPTKGTREEVTIDDGASIFKIGPLDVFLMAHIYDNASKLSGKQGSDEVGIETRLNKTNIDAVRFGLRALPENWQSRDGKRVLYEVEKVTVNGREYVSVKDHVLDSLGVRLIGEMADKIKDMSEVSPGEGKDSVQV